MSDIPDWARRGRAAWQHIGATRPAFAEKPGPGQESVWDYPRPPRAEPDARRIRVLHGDVVIADTRGSVRVLETSHPPTFYLPRGDVSADLLVDSGSRSRCEWKGEATLYDVRVGSELVTPAGWCYPHPFAEFERIAGYVAFYASSFACFVDDERVRPQPGGFYGGWITRELRGPFKGDLGSTGW